MAKQNPALQITNSPTPLPSFFTRNKLTPKHLTDCYNLISQLYPNQPITLAPSQGYCSFTLLVGPSTIIQFRPTSSQLDLALSGLASATHPIHAPATSHIATLRTSRLEVYAMSRIPGISLRDFRSHSPILARSTSYLEHLVVSLAAFLARSWHFPPPGTVPLGKVGSSIVARLELLSSSLPLRFRGLAKKLLRDIGEVTSLPWVFTHGDLVPGNIMMSPTTGALTGLVDWAEAEFLPFGVCLYGLEEMLGEMTTEGFRYYPQAERLRGVFWEELGRGVKEIGEGGEVLERVRMARDLGVLLWWGIAWDDGRIDRVVEEGKDVEEVMRLDAYLNSCEEETAEVTLHGASKL